MFATYSTLAGLIGQIKHSKGMHADVALIEASIASAVWETTEYLSSGVVPQQLERIHTEPVHHINYLKQMIKDILQ